MRTKRVLSVIFSALFAINSAAFLTVSSAAASAVVLTVSSGQGAPGSNVAISVTISANSGLAAGGFDLLYDKTKLEVVTAQKGAALSSGIADVFSDTANSRVRLSYINATGFNGSGSILDVVFKIKAAAAGVIPVTLTVSDFANVDYNPIPKTVVNGSVTVTGTDTVNILCGDTIVNDVLYNKIGWFKCYKKQSVQLGYSTSIASSKITKVEWSSDNGAIAVDITGKCTPTVSKHCSANITVTVTDTLSKTYQKTVLVKFYKFNFQKDK